MGELKAQAPLLHSYHWGIAAGLVFPSPMPIPFLESPEKRSFSFSAYEAGRRTGVDTAGPDSAGATPNPMSGPHPCPWTPPFSQLMLRSGLLAHRIRLGFPPGKQVWNQNMEHPEGVWNLFRGQWPVARCKHVGGSGLEHRQVLRPLSRT